MTTAPTSDDDLLVSLWRWSGRADRGGSPFLPDWINRGWTNDAGKITPAGEAALESNPAVLAERLASLTRTDGGSAQISSIKLPDGKEVTIGEWQDRPLYSSIDLFPAGSSLRAISATQDFSYGRPARRDHRAAPRADADEARRARRKMARKSRRKNRA